MRISDWSSDVCSSDLRPEPAPVRGPAGRSDDRRAPRGGLGGGGRRYAAVRLRHGGGERLDCAVARGDVRGARRALCRQGEPVRAVAGGNRAARRRARYRLGGGTRARRGADAARSEEHTSELQSLMRISYAVFCLKKKKPQQVYTHKHSKNVT